MKKILLLGAIVLSLTGCNTLKIGCGHITGTEVTIPYAGGKANGNAYGCYSLSFNLWGSKPTPPDMTAITTEYIKDASKDNTIAATGPGTITFTPSK